MAKRIISFTVTGLTELYLKDIEKDLKHVGNTSLMKKIISEYYCYKYGENARNKIRVKYLEIYD